jgi:chromosome segregation ATPase
LVTAAVTEALGRGDTERERIMSVQRALMKEYERAAARMATAEEDHEDELECLQEQLREAHEEAEAMAEEIRSERRTHHQQVMAMQAKIDRLREENAQLRADIATSMAAERHHRNEAHIARRAHALAAFYKKRADELTTSIASAVATEANAPPRKRARYYSFDEQDLEALHRESSTD